MMITTTILSFLLSLSPARAAGTADAKADPEIVSVNGASIRKSDFEKTLVKDYGALVLESLINRILIEQEAQARKIEPDKAELNKQVDALRSKYPNEEAFLGDLKSRRLDLDTLRGEIGHELVVRALIVQSRKLSVPDKDVKTAFDKNKDRLAEPPAVHLRHIQVATKKEADDVVARIKTGEDFKKLAGEKSLAKSGKLTGGDYGLVRPGGGLPPEIDKAVFSMKTGEIRIVASKLGQHVLQVVETRASKPAEFDKIKDGLRDAMLTEKIQAALPDYVRELREKASIKYAAENK